jgi:hypothetical protein
MSNNRSSVSPSVGVTFFTCERCRGAARVALSFEDVARIRVSGGGSASARCACGSVFSVGYKVWSPIMGR